MIKYCFCFFLCVLTINGAEEVEEAEPCYESSIIKCGPIKALGELDDIFDYDSFWAPNKFLSFQHFGLVKLPDLPVLNNIIKKNYDIEIIGDITKLSEHILQIFATRAPENNEGPFRLYFKDFPLIDSGLNAFLKIIGTPDPRARGRIWKVQAFIRCFERIWKTKAAQIEMTNQINIQAITEMNTKLRQALAIILGLKRDFDYTNFFKHEYPTLANWADTCTKNESGKPIEAVLTICLIDAYTKWQTPNLVPVVTLPSYLGVQHSEFSATECPTSSRRIEQLKKMGIGKSATKSSTMMRSSNSMHYDNSEKESPFMTTFSFSQSQEQEDSSDDDSDDTDYYGVTTEYGVGDL